MKPFRISVLLTALFSFSPLFAQITILSGPEKGSYYEFVNDISNIVGEKTHLKITNSSTGGAVINFKNLTNPSSNDKLAIISSDFLNLMIAQDKMNNTNKTNSLKVVMQLATEEIQLIVKKNSGIQSMQDLVNKKVGIGSDEQGSSSTGKMMKERSKINWYPFNIGYDEMLKRLSNGSIDAALFVGSAPINIIDIEPQVMTQEYTILPLSDFNGWAKYYENDTIPAGTYKWYDKETPTFSIRMLLVENEDKLSNEDKKNITILKNGIIQNLPLLKKQGHPQWNTVLIPDDSQPEETVATPSVQPIQSNNNSVVYRVQIYSRNYNRAEQISINNQNYNTFVYNYKGAFRYTIGEFTTFSEAVAFQKSCKTSGYTDAFVAAFKNNERSNDASLLK